MARYFGKWFHKRNIIIVSERKVKHVPISGAVQFSALVLTISGVCWASYSTGSFMAARLALREQSRTLRSVANARIENNFSTVYRLSPLAAGDAGSGAAAPMTGTLSDPMFTLSALDHDKLYARIAYLEYKVAQLKGNNEAIIERVREKTSGSIDALETVIRHTGLSPETLKKQVARSSVKAEGGPYIPDDPIILPSEEYQMYANLDKLAMLRRIVGNLPLAAPIRDAQRESPFGHRIDPFTGHLAFHPGVDLAGPVGSKIFATADGVVAAAGWNGGYGNAVDINHGFGITTRYGHMSKILVTIGQKIKKGDIIGIEGSTGRSTGPHLHYEVRYHGQPMNPEKFLHAGDYVSEE
ncbi:MAG: M23 family metallopeptidase [Pseudomonadota bacterium]|nr:M23 family metallopeptidase [Pseudomonadota bacterium]